MAPRREAFPYVRLGNQNHGAAGNRAARHKHQRRKIAGAQIRNDEKCDEEDGRTAEVAHQAEEHHHRKRQRHEQTEVTLSEQSVKRCSARKDIAKLGKLGRLETEAPDFDPVGGAVLRVPEYDRQKQKPDSGRSREPAEPLDEVQVAQYEPEGEIQNDTHYNRGNLFI